MKVYRGKKKVNIKYLMLRIKKKIIPSKFNSKDFCQILKIKGIKIGNGTYFFGPTSTVVDTQRPSLIEIGKYCKITANVTILAHDYSRSVIRLKYGEILGEAKKTIIKDNVFIGINSIILPGAQIGNNVIIGAGSVVSGKIPDNSVAAGNPARVIRTLDEYYTRRKSKYIQEAKDYARYLSENGVMPTIENMGEFFPIYLPRSLENLSKYNINTKLNGDDEKDIINKFINTQPVYNSFSEFIKDCNL